LAAVIIWLARCAVADPVYPFRIHSTLRDWDKNIMPCQSILLSREAGAQRVDDIDGADTLIYGARRLSPVKSRHDVSGHAAAPDRHRSIFGDAR
jgi:hypothetical protein